MNTIQQLRAMGQSLWLDNITRALLDTGKLQRYRDEFCITGLTSNPTIFDEAIGKSETYDTAILPVCVRATAEAIFVALALEDLRRAADCSRPYSSPRMELTAGSPWNCHRCWLTTRRAVSPQPRAFTRKATGRICS